MAKTGTVIQEENKQLKARGFAVGTLDDVAARVTWYLLDGMSIHNLPCDQYHRDKYIAKGWSLNPPPQIDEDTSKELQDEADDAESEERKPRRGRRVPNPSDELIDAALAEPPESETEVQAPEDGESE